MVTCNNNLNNVQVVFTRNLLTNTKKLDKELDDMMGKLLVMRKMIQDMLVEINAMKIKYC
jgi:hypothetical protein